MNTQDIERLKAEIKAEVLKGLTGKGYQTSGTKMGVYDEVRERYKKPLLEAYGVYHFDQVWQIIRRLSCYKAGVRYVRDLTPSKEIEAAKFAEMLCGLMLEGKVNDMALTIMCPFEAGFLDDYRCEEGARGGECGKCKLAGLEESDAGV